MGRWASVFLVSVLTLASCGDQYPTLYGNESQLSRGRPTVLGLPGERGGTQGLGGHRVAILVPLSGPRAGLGTILVQAAQLANQGNGTATLDVLDTAGTASGAATAAGLAASHGDAIILGPLTSSETAAVAPTAQGSGIPVLAFTNDSAQARPGVWPLGISPGQQIRRLVAAAQAQGRSRFAALLPDSEFGRAMASALQDALQAASLPNASVRMHAPGMAAITASIRELSDYANRRGPIDAQVKKLKLEGTADARHDIAQLQKTPIPPPPFDALLLADTGDDLQEIAAVLSYYDIDRSVVQIVGPALWADRASGSGAVVGAWFAAPDMAMRSGFAQAYQERYGAPAPAIADVAYDAALIASFVSAGSGGYMTSLTQPSGFVGSDGLVMLMPDGHVRRGLAVFKVDRGGPSMVDAPLDTSAPAGF